MLFNSILAISSADPLDLAPLIYGFVVMVAVISAFIGFWRGFMRQTVRTITVIISAIVSYALVYFIFAGISKYIDGKSAEEIISALINSGVISEDGAGYKWIASLDAHSLKLFLSVPLALVALPVIYVVCFILVSGILLPLHKFISALCGFKARRSTLGARLMGFLLGAVQGICVAGILLVPVIGVGSLAKDAALAINEHAPEDSFTEKCNEAYVAYAFSVVENPVTVAYETFGVGALYEKISTVNVDGKEYNMTEIFPDLPLLASDVMSFGGCDPKSLTEEEEARVRSMLSRIEENPILTDILASAVRSGSYAYADGSFPAVPGEPFNTLISSSLEIFHTSTPENLSGDLNTLAEVYFTLSRSGVLTAFYDGHEAIALAMSAVGADGKTTAQRIVEIARTNERISPLVTTVAKLTLTAMQKGVGIGEDAMKVFEDVKSKINTNVLTVDKNAYETEEEYVAEISSALDGVLVESGILLEEEELSAMADFVADNFSETKELTDEDACEIIFSYYNTHIQN